MQRAEVFSPTFPPYKASRASFSSTYRQRRTWIWLQYAESAQETSRRKKYVREAFIKRHLWNKCSTGRYSNPPELICKTIEHVIRISWNNNTRRAGSMHSARLNSDLYCLAAVKHKRKCKPETMESGLKDKTDRGTKTKADAFKIQPSQSARQ